MQDKCANKYNKGQYWHAEGGLNRGIVSADLLSRDEDGNGDGDGEYGITTATAIAKFNALLRLLN